MAEMIRIRTVNDLLKIPADRRSACFREVEYLLAMHELAYEGVIPPVELIELQWTDDGEDDISLLDETGQHIVTLKLTPDGQAEQGDCTTS